MFDLFKKKTDDEMRHELSELKQKRLAEQERTKIYDSLQKEKALIKSAQDRRRPAFNAGNVKKSISGIQKSGVGQFLSNAGNVSLLGSQKSSGKPLTGFSTVYDKPKVVRHHVKRHRATASSKGKQIIIKL